MDRRRGWSLRVRLSVLLVATLFPLGGLAGYWIVWEAQRERGRAESEAGESAARLAAQVGYHVGAVQKMLSVLALMPEVQVPQRGEAQLLFGELLATSPYFENVFVVAPDGTLAATAVPPAPGARISARDRVWFQIIVRTRQPTAGGFQVGRVTGKPTAILAAPLLDGQGRILGVVGAALRLAALSREVAAEQRGGGFQWGVVDGQGLVLLHRDADAGIGKPLESLRGMLRGESPVPRTDWRAVVGIPEAVVAARARERLLVIALPAGLVLLAATVVGFWIARNTWRPLQRLARAAGEAGTASPQASFAVEAGGEVGELAEALNGLMARLHQARAADTRRLTELQVLNTIGREVTSALDLDQVLNRAMDLVLQATGLDAASIRLVEETRGEMPLVAQRGYVRADVHHGVTQRVGDGFSGRVAQRGTPAFIEDTADVPDLARVREVEGIQAVAGIPLLASGRVVGTLSVSARRAHQFSEGERRLLIAVGNQLGVAIENARLYAEAERRRRTAESLADLGRLISQSLDPKEVGQQVVTSVTELLGALHASLSRLEPESGDLASVALGGDATLTSDQTPILPRGTGAAGLAVLERRPVVTADLLADPQITLTPELRARIERATYRSVLAVPLIVKDRVIGALGVGDRPGRVFTTEEIRLAQTFADQAATALEKAWLHQESIRRTQELAALHAIASAVNQTLDLDALLQIAVDKVQEVTGKRVVFIRTLDRTTNLLVLRGHRGLPPAYVEATPTIPVGMGGTGWVLQAKQSLCLPKASTDPRLERLVRFMGSGEWSYFCAPMLLKGEVIGTLSVSSDRPDDFTPEEQRLIEAIASPIGVAVENAHLHQELRHYAATLEERVRERTQQLEIANQHKSEFLANMSHELRTPLNAVIGFSSVLEEGLHGPLTEKQRRYVGHIHSSGKHLLGIINDILDITKIEAGRLTLHPEAFGLEEALRAAVNDMRVEAEGKGLTLQVQAGEGLGLLVADPLRFKQILYNLLSNAVKFTPAGGQVTVTPRRLPFFPSPAAASSGTTWEATAGPAEGESECVEIAVADTGIGIKAEDLGKLFKEFSQLDPSLARQYEGTGLGLALTKRLVELHGGTVAGASLGVGQGSTFTITLPLRPAASRGRILVVEDEQPLRAGVAEALRNAGFEVAEAADGEAALAQVQEAPPALVVLDLLLPGLDGFEVLRRLRVPGRTERLPVIVLTGLEAERVKEALSLGADEFLAKPFSLAVLTDAVERLLGRAPRATGGSRGPADRPGMGG